MGEKRERKKERWKKAKERQIVEYIMMKEMEKKRKNNVKIETKHTHTLSHRCILGLSSVKPVAQLFCK